MSVNSSIHSDQMMYRLVNFVLLGLPLFLLIDSPWAAQFISHGQDICNIISIVTYSLFLFYTREKLYWLILLMTLCGLGGEIFGSLILGLYEYRLKNIPVYIPLGHALLYAMVYYTSRHPCIIRNKVKVKQCLAQFAFLAAFLSLFMINDVAGFLGYLTFLVVLRFRKNKLFYLFMFAMTYYLELMGTIFYTWSWYGVTGAHPHFPPIGFTPSAAAILYVFVDLMINSLYFYFLKILRFVYRIVPELKIKELRTQEN
ncbi:hypothetical protein [Legionella cincinnatiensis]|uniref:Uncharacterized protein n=1 Tax=Legionella cincinnatiensis TaxID=28085 RepID=A0A378IJT1_9GAMM|nr:hypothetical protein [Legionella cincinnatiensis]KTC83441.1 hypothetical protein Lcin_2128 [Legionella cincinnatiensis]STX35527.1 Uncharacterised protein [Legionella cincinnatiensis]